MAGWADMILGSTNPFAQWADSNAYVRSAMGAGLASGQNFESGLSNAVQGIPQARQAQNAYDMSLKDQQTRLDQIEYERTLQQNALKLQADARQQAADWATKNGHGDVAPLLQSGALTGSDIYNSDNKMSFAPAGSVPYLGNKPAPGAGAASTFYGGDEKSRAWNYLVQANQPGADPVLKQKPDYQAAWAIATMPTSTPNGLMQPQVPPSWAPGTTPAGGSPGVPDPGAIAGPAAAQAQAPAASPPEAPASATGNGMPMIAQPASVQPGPGVIAGTKPFNESQARTTFLAQSAIPDLKRVIDGYPALTNFKDQVAGAVPGGLGRMAQSSEYKQTRDAMSSSMVDLLYFASGANINKDEWARKTDAYLPAIGDDGKTAANKLDRFATDVISLANSSNDPNTIAWAKQAVAGIKATEDKLLNQGKPAQTAPGDQTKVPAGKIIYGPGGKQYVMGADGIPKPVI